jgi:uncharacterized membrane protein
MPAAPAPLGLLPLLLAVGSAAAYGAADFAGGLAARRASGLAAAAGAQGTGLVLVALLTLLGPEASPTRHDVLWGAFSGLCGGSGLALFFAALARGRMSTVAPVAAVISAALPVAVGLARGERPSVLALIGIATAGAAIVLVSREDEHLHGADTHDAAAAMRTTPQVLLLAAASGVMFGGFFTALAQTAAAAGFWPILVNRSLSATGLLLGLAFGPAVHRMGVRDPRFLRAAMLSGLLDIAATWLFHAASTRGMLSLVAPLGSLYPATTVLLAVLLLGERLGKAQRAGLVLAGATLLLIAL